MWFVGMTVHAAIGTPAKVGSGRVNGTFIYAVLFGHETLLGGR